MYTDLPTSGSLITMHALRLSRKFARKVNRLVILCQRSKAFQEHKLTPIGERTGWWLQMWPGSTQCNSNEGEAPTA